MRLIQVKIRLERIDNFHHIEQGFNISIVGSDLGVAVSRGARIESARIIFQAPRLACAPLI